MKKEMKKEIVDRICEDWDIYDDDALMFMGGSPEDYADCIVGIVEDFEGPAKVCYDKNKILNRFVKEGMSYSEAREYFDFNVIGAYLGKTTPVFITRYSVSRRKNGTPAKDGKDRVD